jgi:hypothetical protein
MMGSATVAPPGRGCAERFIYETENVALTDVEKIFRAVDARPPKDIEERARQLLTLAHGIETKSCAQRCSIRWRPRRRWAMTRQFRPTRRTCRRSPW